MSTKKSGVGKKVKGYAAGGIVGGAASGAATGAVAGPIGAGIGGVIGGIIGAGNSSGASGNANNLANIQNDILQALAAAPDISKPLILQQYKQAGLLTPEMEQNISAGPSAMAGVQTDAQSLNAQRQALQQLQQRSTQGLTAADRAGLNQARQQVASDTQAKQAQILQGAAQRGQSTNGATLAAQLSSSQNGANDASAAADRMAQMAQSNALNATAQSGQLGGQINQQQFGQAAQKATLADQMNRFNTQNALGVQQQNTQATNQAQAGNLANAQGLSNQNVTAGNQEQNNQLQREMQQWGANTNLGQIKAGGAGTLGTQQQNLANTQAQSAVNMGTGLGGAVSSAFGLPSSGSSNSVQQNNDNYANANQSGGGFSPAQWSGSNGGQVPRFNQGGRADYTGGGHVSGQARVPGDSPLNDVVKANLSPGEIVIPRSLAESKIGKEMLKLIHAHNSVKNKMNGQD